MIKALQIKNWVLSIQYLYFYVSWKLCCDKALSTNTANVLKATPARIKHFQQLREYLFVAQSSGFQKTKHVHIYIYMYKLFQLFWELIGLKEFSGCPIETNQQRLMTASSNNHFLWKRSSKFIYLSGKKYIEKITKFVWKISSLWKYIAPYKGENGCYISLDHLQPISGRIP